MNNKKLKRTPQFSLGSKLVKKLVQEGEKVFKPIIKDYSSNTEMFTDFIKQGKDQGIPIDRSSKLYKQIQDEGPSLKSYYEGQDLKSQFKKEITPYLEKIYDENWEIKLNNKAIQNLLEKAETTKDTFAIDWHKNKLKNNSKSYFVDKEFLNPEKIESHFKNKNFYSPDNPFDRLYIRGELDNLPKIFNKEAVTAKYKNQPDELVEDLADYDINSVLDLNKKLQQEVISEEVIDIENSFLPDFKSLQQYKGRQKKLPELISTANVLVKEYNKTKDTSLLPEIRAMQNLIANIKDYNFLKKRSWLDTVKNKFSKKKELTTDQVIDGTYLSMLLANKPKDLKFLTKSSEIYDPVYKRPLNSNFTIDSNTIKGDGVNSGFFGKPTLEGSFRNDDVIIKPTLVKSLFREHLGKWDWSNPDIHKAIGAGITFGIGSSQMKRGGKHKLKRIS